MSSRCLVLAAALLSLPCVARESAAATFTDVTAFSAATTGLVTDDFESAPWVEGNYAGGVQHLGVTWSAVGVLRATTFMPRSGRLSLSDLDPTPGPDTLDELGAVMPGGVTAAGGWFRSTIGVVPVEVTAYDASQAAIASFTATLFDSHVFLGLTSDVPIARLRMRAQRFPDDFLLDDFSFGAARVAPVPEPGPISALGLGLLAVASRLRRGSRANAQGLCNERERR